MDTQPRRWSAPGAALLLVGGAIIAVVMAADVGGTPALEALAIRLGLAFAPLLLAIGLSLTMTGLWMLWRARHSSE
jgi:hypothetical protein